STILDGHLATRSHFSQRFFSFCFNNFKKTGPVPATSTPHNQSSMSTSNEPAAGRAAINRANWQRSTASVRKRRPRTPHSKARSSLNAMKHGPREDLAADRRFAKQYFHELKSKGVIKTQIVQNLADG